ncbi:MAG: group 1 glycosyl transferase [Acidobacteria bacterium]|nr:MAG: group 1 glycosyl transferase [Acidobacteriota bacterium]
MAALVPYAPCTTPSQRFRIEQWIPHLHERGIEVRVLPFAGPVLTRWMQSPGHVLRKASFAAAAVARRTGRIAFGRLGDVVLIHRAAALFGPPVLERLLTLRGRPLVFDFDDAIFLPHETETNRRLAWLKSPGKTGTICRLSAHVVVGNGYLAEYARGFNPRVTIVPSSIDTDRYAPRPCATGGKVVVGWMGTSSSQTYLEVFAGMLREVAALPGVEIRVISNRRPELPGVPVVWHPWSAGTEAEDVAGFDVGIMPMPDTDWARGKCALKGLQYMAMGVATVASAVGANREVIEHGRNGLLASTDAEWVASLRTLVENPELRARLGRAGRVTVEARYSMRSSAAAFAEVVRSVVERTRA